MGRVCVCVLFVVLLHLSVFRVNGIKIREKRALGKSIYDKLAASTGGGSFRSSGKGTAAIVSLATKILAGAIVKPPPVRTTTTSQLVMSLVLSAAEPSRTISFPLDGSMGDAFIIVTGKDALKISSSVTLTNPSGKSEPKADTRVYHYVGTTTLKIWVMPAAAAAKGLWKLSLPLKEHLEIRVEGDSTVSFIYDIIDPTLGVPIPGNPIAGKRATLSVRLNGLSQITTAEKLELRDRTSTAVSPSALTQPLPWLPQEFEGTALILEKDEIVVRISGKDKAGRTFMRESDKRITPARVRMEWNIHPFNRRDPLPGQAVVLGLTLTNLGPDASLDLSVIDGTFGAHISPRTLFLAKNSSGAAEINLRVAKSLFPGTFSRVKVQIRSGGRLVNELSRVVSVDFPPPRPVGDVTSPFCDVISVTGYCPVRNKPNCTSDSWYLDFRARDAGGLARVSLASSFSGVRLSPSSLPSGALDHNLTVKAPCCASAISLFVMDKAGNTKACSASLPLLTTTRALTTRPPTPTTTETTPLPVSVSPPFPYIPVLASAGSAALVLLASIIGCVFYAKRFNNLKEHVKNVLPLHPDYPTWADK